MNTTHRQHILAIALSVALAAAFAPIQDRRILTA
jgi:hypothetical protein